MEGGAFIFLSLGRDDAVVVIDYLFADSEQP
jgi:hypothetical protein